MTSNSQIAAVRRSARGFVDFAQTMLGYAVLILVLALLAGAVIVPRASDAVPYTVLTSSMKPTYPPGTLIIVRTVPVEALGIGDVITYQLESDKPAVVTHRVIGVGYAASGERTFLTQGDNNSAPDEKPVRAVQVRGEVWYSIPLLGYVNSWMAGSRDLMTNVVVAFLLGYALWMFLSGSRKRTKKALRPALSYDGGEE